MVRAAVIVALVPFALVATEAIWLACVYRAACRERGERPATLDLFLNGIMLAR
jgi:hypothetical protein